MNFTSFQAVIFKFSVLILLVKGYFRLRKQAFQALESFVSMRPECIKEHFYQAFATSKYSTQNISLSA